MDDQRIDPAAHYDRVTEAWGSLLGDELHYGIFDTGDEALPEATRALTGLMVEACEIAEGVEVLDVGCGTGAPACELARRGARVTGITTSEVGITAARNRAEREGLADRAVFEQRDGMANGYPDGSFDRVWVLESSHLMRDRALLLAECARVLRAGGRLALCDIVLRRPMPFPEVRKRLRPLMLLREVFGDARMEEISTYRSLAEASGLRVDVARDLTAETRPTFDRWRTNAQGRADEVVGAFGGGDWQLFIEACDVLEAYWDDGTLGYGLIAAVKP